MMKVETIAAKGAIRQWKQEADMKYQYVLLPLDAQTNGNEVTVRARLTGTFSCVLPILPVCCETAGCATCTEGMS